MKWIQAVGSLLVILVLGGSIAGGFLYAFLHHPRELIQVMAYGAVLGILVVPVFFGALYFFVRKTSPKRVLIWFRRFHRVESSRFPMSTVLQRVGAAWFHVLTLQDTSVRYSMMVGYQRSFWWLTVLVLSLLIPSLLFGFSVAAFLFVDEAGEVQASSWVVSATTVLLFFVPYLVVGAPAQWLMSRVRGVVRLRDHAKFTKIQKWAARVREGVGAPNPGVKIFRCEHAFWRPAVLAALEASDGAIVDVTNINESIVWEIRQCLARFAPRQITFVYRADPADFPAEPPESLLELLHEMGGDGCVRESHFVSYPEPLPVRFGRAMLSPDLEASVSLQLHEALDDVLGGSRLNHLAARFGGPDEQPGCARLLASVASVPDATDLQRALRDAGFAGAVHLDADDASGWRVLRVLSAEGDEVVRVTRELITHDSLGQSSLAPLRDQVHGAKPIRAANWLSNYFDRVRCLYTFELTDSTQSGNAWGVFDVLRDGVWDVCPGILQDDGIGFTNEYGALVMLERPEEMEGQWLVGLRAQHGWLHFELATDDEVTVAQFLADEPPEEADFEALSDSESPLSAEEEAP